MHGSKPHRGQRLYIPGSSNIWRMFNKNIYRLTEKFCTTCTRTFIWDPVGRVHLLIIFRLSILRVLRSSSTVPDTSTISVFFLVIIFSFAYSFAGRLIGWELCFLITVQSRGGAVTGSFAIDVGCARGIVPVDPNYRCVWIGAVQRKKGYVELK